MAVKDKSEIEPAEAPPVGGGAGGPAKALRQGGSEAWAIHKISEYCVIQGLGMASLNTTYTLANMESLVSFQFVK